MDQKIGYPEDGNATSFDIEENSFWFNSRNDIICNTAGKYLAPHAQFADVGGGNGYVSYALMKQLSLDITLIEPGPVGIQNAHKRGIKQTIQGTHLDYLKQFKMFHNIGMFDVLEHIPEDEKILTELLQSQKDGSYLFLTVPAFSFAWSSEDIDADHVRRYTKRELESLLKKVGYSVVECRYFFILLLLPILLFRSLPYRLGVVHTRAQSQQDHLPNPVTHKLITSFIKIEEFLARLGIKFPFGASIIAVAQKR